MRSPFKVPNHITSVFGRWVLLVALGLVGEQMAFTLVLVVVNVGSNWLLVPRYGGIGAGIATALTELALLGFCAPLVWREMHKRMRARLA